MKVIIYLIIGLVYGFNLPAQSRPGSALLDEDCMEAGSASIGVYDLDKKEYIFSHDLVRALPTASIQKLLTTAAVLKRRGADFRYETTIGYVGVVSNRILKGDLIIVGAGDPTLGSGNFSDVWTIDRIAENVRIRLKELNIDSISGQVVLDQNGVPGQHVPGGWPWSDLGNYYGAGHYAINIGDNEYKIFFKQNRTTGQKVDVLRTIPENLSIDIGNEVRTGLPGSGDQAYIYSAPYADQVFVRGTIPPGEGSFSIRGSLTLPPQYFGNRLCALLQQSGLRIQSGFRYSDDQIKGVVPVFTILSPALIDIIRVTNYRSVNLYAEGLLKLLCNEDHNVSQFQCGLDALQSFWKEVGLDKDQFYFKDGSGLSPRNTASANIFVEALQAIYEDKSWYDPFTTALAEMGKDGTLQYMLRGYSGAGTIHAKSGYIGRQRSYAGYMKTESGRNLAFCVILDNYSCSSTRIRQRIERFLIGYLRE